MKQEQSHEYAAACFHGEYASCSYACPFRMDIRTLMDKVRKGSFQAAYRILRDAVVFPEIVTELCDAPCREHCVRKINGQPLSVREIEKACIMHARSKEPKDYNIPAKNKTVVIIGAGSSGLACALRLAVKKYRIEVYEAQDEIGGALLMHEKAGVFAEELKRQISHEDIRFHFGERVTSLEDLSYDAVYIATGKSGGDFGLLEGWDEQNLSTVKEGCFLGGMITGIPVVEAIAQGVSASRQIEKYLLTDTVRDNTEEFPYENCERYLCGDLVTDLPEITASDGVCYSQEEAKEEASRCLQCDCSKCMDSCEMLKHFNKSPQKVVKEIYTDSIVLPGMSHRTLTREVAACNMCGECRTVCPNSVDMGAAFLFARRDRAAAGNYPKVFHEYWLRQMDFSVREASILKTPLGKENCRYLFFPGCQLGSSSPNTVKAAYESLLKLTDNDTGLMLICCGAPAYWAGEESLHAETLARIRQFWESSGKGTVICACMTCIKVFREMMPEIPVMSLYDYLAERPGSPNDAAFKGAVFDPCSAREEGSARRAVRRMLDGMKVKHEELPFHDERAKCCGWGGHIYPANPELFREIVDKRICAADLPYIVYCSNCRDVFAAAGKHCVHVLDLYFGADTGKRGAPSIKEKHDNSLYLKQSLLKDHWNESCEIPGFEGDNMKLLLTDKLKKKTGELLLSEDILRKAVTKAEKENDKFIDHEGNHFICSWKDGDCTIWVHYRPAGEEDAFEIVNVYMHRMKVLER